MPSQGNDSERVSAPGNHRRRVSPDQTIAMQPEKKGRYQDRTNSRSNTKPRTAHASKQNVARTNKHTPTHSLDDGDSTLSYVPAAPPARQHSAVSKRDTRNQRKKKSHKPAIIALIVSIMVVCAAVALLFHFNVGSNGQQAQIKGNSELKVTSSQQESNEVTLVAVGDVLVHTPILNFALQDDGTYDFNSIFAMTSDLSQSADIAICNQETVIDHNQAPDGGIEYQFNTPDAIGDAEINAGYDVIQQCSNHSLDKHIDGALATVEYWKTKAGQATMVGLYSSREERDTITVIEKNGIKFAFLNYTYGLNGYSIPSGYEYVLTELTSKNKSKIIDDIQRADQIADFTIVLPHWGSEDIVGEPLDSQVYWAQVFTEAGADLIIGTHPHVSETIEWINSSNGNKALCYYSIGNFATNQQELAEVLGGMAKVKIVKDETGTHIDENETGVIPLVTHNERWGSMYNYVVAYKLSDYTEELASQHIIAIAYDSTFSLASLQQMATEIYGNWILDS